VQSLSPSQIDDGSAGIPLPGQALSAHVGHELAAGAIPKPDILYPPVGDARWAAPGGSGCGSGPPFRGGERTYLTNRRTATERGIARIGHGR
jgi:hypothetical protein